MTIRFEDPISIPDGSDLTLNTINVKRGVDVQQATYRYQTEHGESLSDMDYVFQGEESDAGYMTNILVRLGGGEFDTLDITYEDIISDEYPVKRYSRKSSVTTQRMEGHANYKTWWNNGIIKKTGTSQTITNATWQAVTDGKPGEARTEFKWLKSTSPIPTDYEMHLQAKHAGKTGYMLPTTEVTETVLTRDEDAAIQAASSVGILEAPDDTFEESEDSTKWLVIGSNIARQGPWWLTTNVFRFADGGWEEDFYD